MTTHQCTDDREAHAALAEKYIRMMSEYFEQEISNQKELNIIAQNPFLPPEIQRACLLWVQQTECSATEFYNDHGLQTHVLHFLKKHLTHWLEAMKLMGKGLQSITILIALENIVEVRLFMMALSGLC